MGLLFFSNFDELRNFNWDSCHPYLSEESMESRRRIRRTGFEILDFMSEEIESDELISYLKDIEFKVYVNAVDLKPTSRMVELFYRTTQMHFNKSYFKENTFFGISKEIEKCIHNDFRFCTASVSIKGRFLGVQGVLLYKIFPDELKVYNATFSCSIIPFKIVEKLLIIEFVNTYLAMNKSVSFLTKIERGNERVHWLLSDLGAITDLDNVFEFKEKIKINKTIASFLKSVSIKKVEEGVPPITTFYDKNVLPIISKLKVDLLDIGYGFGEVLGASRYHDLESRIIENQGTVIKGDVFPKDTDTLMMDVQEMCMIENESIDFIFCLELIEHVESPAKAISEILRSLRIGGFIFLSTPGHAYPYHPFKKDISRFSSNFLLKLFGYFGQVLKYEVQHYSGNELRTILLFKKERRSDAKKVQKLFKNSLFPERLPMNLILYS